MTRGKGKKRVQFAPESCSVSSNSRRNKKTVVLAQVVAEVPCRDDFTKEELDQLYFSKSEYHKCRTQAKTVAASFDCGSSVVGCCLNDSFGEKSKQIQRDLNEWTTSTSAVVQECRGLERWACRRHGDQRQVEQFSAVMAILQAHYDLSTTTTTSSSSSSLSTVTKEERLRKVALKVSRKARHFARMMGKADSHAMALQLQQEQEQKEQQQHRQQEMVVSSSLTSIRKQASINNGSADDDDQDDDEHSLAGSVASAADSVTGEPSTVTSTASAPPAAFSATRSSWSRVAAAASLLSSSDDDDESNIFDEDCDDGEYGLAKIGFVGTAAAALALVDDDDDDDDHDEEEERDIHKTKSSSSSSNGAKKKSPSKKLRLLQKIKRRVSGVGGLASPLATSNGDGGHRRMSFSSSTTSNKSTTVSTSTSTDANINNSRHRRMSLETLGRGCLLPSLLLSSTTVASTNGGSNKRGQHSPPDPHLHDRMTTPTAATRSSLLLGSAKERTVIEC